MKNKLALSFVIAFLFNSSLLFAAEIDIQNKYQPVVPEQPTESGNKIEVVELFWYGCPHCYTFEPYIDDWAKSIPDDVEFRRMPAVFRESWAVHARAYYALEQMDKLEPGHLIIFNALHRDKKRINTREQIADLLANDGIDKDLFLQQYDSFATEARVRKATVMSRRYGVRGVPSVIIAGKYRTSGSIAGNFGNVIKVINALVDKERKAN